MGIEQRILRGDRLEGTVRVPEAVADGELPAPVVGGERLAVPVEVRHIRECRRQPMIFRPPQSDADRLLDRAEASRERELLLVGQVLAAEDQDRVGVHCLVDGLDVVLDHFR